MHLRSGRSCVCWEGARERQQRGTLGWQLRLRHNTQSRDTLRRVTQQGAQDTRAKMDMGIRATGGVRRVFCCGPGFQKIRVPTPLPTTDFAETKG